MVEYVDLNQISQMQGCAPVSQQPQTVYIPAMHASGRDEFVSSSGSGGSSVGMVATVGALILGGATLIACKGKGLKAFAEDAVKFIKGKKLNKDSKGLGLATHVDGNGTYMITRMGQAKSVDKVAEEYGIALRDAKGDAKSPKQLLKEISEHHAQLASDADALGVAVTKDPKTGEIDYSKLHTEVKAAREALEKDAKDLEIKLTKEDGTKKSVKELQEEIEKVSPGHYNGATGRVRAKLGTARALHDAQVAAIDAEIEKALEKEGLSTRQYRGFWSRLFNLNGKISLKKVLAEIKKLENAKNLSKNDKARLDTLRHVRDLLDDKKTLVDEFKAFEASLNVKGLSAKAKENRIEKYFDKLRGDRENLPEEVQRKLDEIPQPKAK